LFRNSEFYFPGSVFNLKWENEKGEIGEGGEFGRRNSERGMRKEECGRGKGEYGMRDGEFMRVKTQPQICIHNRT
jgi:hypothetical protein